MSEGLAVVGSSKTAAHDFMWRPGVWRLTLLLDQQSITVCESAPPPAAAAVPSLNEVWVMLLPH